ncbi:hypothetical protein LTY59_09395 [Limosilactobacillus balticus]|uniref:Uncharacterized protein n=1 Tax=Limosilactobacillus balticus TaxID=2759747 RepID=A0ABS8REF4_9LACO|nr:hypothetical protein [Limosilactobacillus balticus]MBB1109530.1 hypothetical protein [Limosilactobacillus balticus]MCD7139412.1 hypothetical protein [Limosilactobacillus balticus]
MLTKDKNISENKGILFNILYSFIIFPFSSYFIIRIYREFFYKKNFDGIINAFVDFFIKNSKDNISSDAFIIALAISFIVIPALSLVILALYHYKQINWLFISFIVGFILFSCSINLNSKLVFLQIALLFIDSYILAWLIQKNIKSLISADKNVESDNIIIKTIGLLIFGMGLLNL